MGDQYSGLPSHLKSKNYQLYDGSWLYIRLSIKLNVL
jgi:hypothetical protein